jgi:hypothetical protein
VTPPLIVNFLTGEVLEPTADLLADLGIGESREVQHGGTVPGRGVFHPGPLPLLDVGPLVNGFLYHSGDRPPPNGPDTEDAACEGEASSGGESRTTAANGDQPHSQVREVETRAVA